MPVTSTHEMAMWVDVHVSAGCLGAVSGKWVLSGKRRAALVRRSALRLAERQSRFHGLSLFSALVQRRSSR